MRLKNRVKEIVVGVLILLVSAHVHAESWIPVFMKRHIILIPQYEFQTNKISPNQYQLSWNAQDDATSYKIERLTFDDTATITSAQIPTHWVTVDELTTTTSTRNHDITSFDLGGHQTYRLSSCVQSECTVLDELHYFVKNSELSNTIAQNFTISATAIYESDQANVQSISTQSNSGPGKDPKENPYEWGHGLSMVSGHENPSGHGKGKGNGKPAQRTIRQSNSNTDPKIVSHSVRLDWALVDNATHYVISRTVIKGESPTKSFLNNSAYSEWAIENAYTYELLGGEFEFKVYACYDTVIDLGQLGSSTGSGFCGGASVQLDHTVTLPVIDKRFPRDVTLSSGGIVEDTEAFNLTWTAPEDVDTDEVLLLGYKVFGELRGLIGAPDHGDTLSLTRNTESLRLVPGRKYCYKIIPQYRRKSDNAVINGQPGYPAPDQCVTVGTAPILPAPTTLTIVEQVEEAAEFYTFGYYFSWTAVTGADSYQLDRVVEFGSSVWAPVYVGPDTNVRQHLTENRNEAYRVSACTADGRCGNYRRLYFWARGTELSWLSAQYKTPSCLKVSDTTDIGQPIAVSWCPPQTPGVTHYEVLDIKNAQVVKAQASSFGATMQGLTTYNVPPQPPGTWYCYHVRAYYGSENYRTQIEDCGFVDMEVPDTPTLAITNVVTGAYTLNWTASTNATKYIVEEAICDTSCNSLSTTDWIKQPQEPTDTSLKFTGKTSGIYAYRVAACTQAANEFCGDFSTMVITTVNNKPISFIHTDLLGTPVAETDAAGRVK